MLLQVQMGSVPGPVFSECQQMTGRGRSPAAFASMTISLPRLRTSMCRQYDQVGHPLASGIRGRIVRSSFQPSQEDGSPHPPRRTVRPGLVQVRRSPDMPETTRTYQRTRKQARTPAIMKLPEPHEHECLPRLPLRRPRSPPFSRNRASTPPRKSPPPDSVLSTPGHPTPSPPDAEAPDEPRSQMTIRCPHLPPGAFAPPFPGGRLAKTRAVGRAHARGRPHRPRSGRRVPARTGEPSFRVRRRDQAPAPEHLPRERQRGGKGHVGGCRSSTGRAHRWT